MMQLVVIVNRILNNLFFNVIGCVSFIQVLLRGRTIFSKKIFTNIKGNVQFSFFPGHKFTA